jgi:hypothetical protein
MRTSVALTTALTGVPDLQVSCWPTRLMAATVDVSGLNDDSAHDVDEPDRP